MWRVYVISPSYTRKSRVTCQTEPANRNTLKVLVKSGQYFSKFVRD